ncbi:MAG: cytochrome c [Candidatus Obscuribacterales bacterium]
MLQRLPVLSLSLSLSALACGAPGSASETGDVNRGKVVFEQHMCVECHKGGGNSVKPSRPVKGKAFKERYPLDADLEKLIRSGVPNSSMPSFGKDVIDEQEMKDLLAYLRSLTPESNKKSTRKSTRKEK